MALPNTHASLRERINTLLAQLLRNIALKQNAYYKTHGRYWQGLLTSTNVPADGNTLPTVRSLHPTDQIETWGDFMPELPAALNIALRVDSCRGVNGDGYVVTAAVKLGGRTFLRSIGFGSEASTDDDWS